MLAAQKRLTAAQQALAGDVWSQMNTYAAAEIRYLLTGQIAEIRLLGAKQILRVLDLAAARGVQLPGIQ